MARFMGTDQSLDKHQIGYEISNGDGGILREICVLIFNTGRGCVSQSVRSENVQRQDRNVITGLSEQFHESHIQETRFHTVR